MTEAEREVEDAQSFNLTVEGLRKQRTEYGQLLTGPYAGCTPAFANMMEISKKVEAIFRELKNKAEEEPHWSD